MNSRKTIQCSKIVEVRGGQALAASRNCSGKVVYIDPMGRGWCKRHEPDEERKSVWEKIAKINDTNK